MNMFNSIKTYLEKKSQDKKVIAPEGLCPNCWGRQEYGGEFFDAMKVEGIDLQNIDNKKGWIQDYAEKNLPGIHLQKKDKSLVCNGCSVSYSTHED